MGTRKVRGNLGFIGLKSEHTRTSSWRNMGCALKGVVSGYRDKKLTSIPAGEPRNCGGRPSEKNKWMKPNAIPCFHDYLKFSWLFLILK